MVWVSWDDARHQSVGGGGQDAITLAAVPASLSATVARWEQPVDAAQQVESIATPDSLTMQVPMMPHTPAAPSLPSQPTPLQPAALATSPSIDTSPPAPPAPKPAPQAVEPPFTPQSSQAPSIPPQSAEQAQGIGQNSTQGHGGDSETGSPDTQREASHLRKWGSAISARIERQKRAGRDQGDVRVQLVVHSSGTLTSVRATSGSGNADLEAQAIATVKRARLPKAPNGVRTGEHSFTLLLSYRR